MIRYLFCIFNLLSFLVQAREFSFPEHSQTHILDLQFKLNCERYETKKCPTVPEFLKAQKQICEINRSSNQCPNFEKEKPQDSWKYIKCDYMSLCLQNNVDVKDDLAACITGATSFAVDFAGLLKDLTHAVLNQVASRNEWIRLCDESLACKRKLAEGQPTTASLTDTELQKKNMASFLWIKKNEFDSARMQKKLNSDPGLVEKARQRKIKLDAVKGMAHLSEADGITLSSIWESVKTKIDHDVRDVSCYIPFEKKRLQCQVLSDVLSGIFIERAIPLRLAKSGKQVSSELASQAASLGERRSADGWVRIAESSEPKKELVAAFAQKNLTSKAENETWLTFISNPKSTQRNLTIENSMLKQMNDKMFKDEEYVTALTNAYKEMQFTKLKTLEADIRKTSPGFQFQKFSDFKSLRLAYDEIPGLDIGGRLQKTTEEVNRDFADYVIKNKLVREADQPGAWFKASLASSDDMANLAAKYARQNNGGNLFVDGTKNQDFQNWVKSEFNQGQKLRSDLVSAFKDTSVVTSKNLAEANLNRDVFEILRKNKETPELAKSLIEKKFGLQPLGDKTFQQLNQYYEKVDAFSPGLRNTERQFATLSEAPHGGISIDMIGLGADHLQATSAQAFVSSKGVEDFLLTTRAGEEKLTAEIFNRKATIEKKFKDITGDANAQVVCSGDGCKAFLKNRSITEAESKKFTDAVTQGGEEGRLRFSDVRGVPQEFQDLVAKQGEDIEKKLRTSLFGKLDQRRLEGLNFSVAIKGAKQPGSGTAQLHIAEAQGLKLSPAEKETIQQAYKKALQELNLGYK